MTFSHDGKLLTAAGGETVQLWDLDSRRELGDPWIT